MDVVKTKRLEDGRKTSLPMSETLGEEEPGPTKGRRIIKPLMASLRREASTTEEGFFKRREPLPQDPDEAHHRFMRLMKNDINERLDQMHRMFN